MNTTDNSLIRQNESETIVEIIGSIENISTQNLEDLKLVSDAGERGLMDMDRLSELVENINRISGELNEVVNG